jgi:uncharacterized protein YbcI
LSGTQLGRDLSREFSALMKEVTGQGPDRCRSYFNREVVTVFVEGSLTEAERRTAQDEIDLAKATRRNLQLQVAKRATPILERITGAEVKAILHDHAIDPDVGVYIFQLDREIQAR